MWMLWYDLVEKFNRLLCRLLGHPKPWTTKMQCSICPRCSKIMEYHNVQLIFPANWKFPRGPNQDGSKDP